MLKRVEIYDEVIIGMMQVGDLCCSNYSLIGTVHIPMVFVFVVDIFMSNIQI